MRLSDTLSSAARFATSPAHAGFLRDAAAEARKLEDHALDSDLYEAHVRFGTPAETAPVQDVTDALIEPRVKLIREEYKELMRALESRDLSAIAGECVDLIYTVVGTMVVLGLPLKPFWSAIHRANMAKRPAPGGGKWIKPFGWVGADLSAILHRVRQGSK
tara:strand:+ start:651 stop:1133 length:483 start_codon:yes stop_codon:yes gene_type:complete